MSGTGQVTTWTTGRHRAPDVAAPVRRIPAVRPWMWLSVALAWSAAVVGTGSDPLVVIGWLASVAFGIVLPGLVLTRAVRPSTVALVDDLAWSVPVGGLVAMVGWAAARLTGWSWPGWGVGVVVALAVAAVPALRARVLARPAPGWGVSTTLGVCAVLLTAVAWMTVDYLRSVPPSPAAGGSAYYPDAVFQLAVVGKLQHSLQLTYPLVHGEPFSYQWFTHAVLAQLIGEGPGRVDMMLRLAPATILPAVVLLAAVVARDLARRDSAAVFAAALVGVFGSAVATLAPDGASLPVFQTYWWASLTTSFGWVATLGAAGAALAYLRCPDGAAAPGSAPTVLLVPLAVLAAGAKPSNLAVLAGGAGLAWLACLLTRRPGRRALQLLAVFAGVLLIARLTIYGGGDYGLRVDPFGSFAKRAAQQFPGLADPPAEAGTMTLPTVSTGAVLAALVLYLIPFVPRVVGLVLLDRRDPRTWFFVGVLVAALGAVAVFRHPAESESFFVLSAYPVLVVGSAAGLAGAWDRLPRRRYLVGATGLVIGALLTLASASWFPTDPRASRSAAFGHAPDAAEMAPWRQAAQSLLPLGAVMLAIVVLTVVMRLLAGGSARRRALAGCVVVAAILGTGLLSTAIYLSGTAKTVGREAVEDSRSTITRDEYAAATWLATASRPDDVLATNRVCLGAQAGPEVPRRCVSKTFALSALSGRDVEVGGWAYASRNLGSAWNAAGPVWAAQPFWDPARLDREQAAFRAPSPAALGALGASGVRWLVADSRGGPVDVAALDRWADRSFSTPTVTVWRLR